MNICIYEICGKAEELAEFHENLIFEIIIDTISPQTFTSMTYCSKKNKSAIFFVL